MRPDAWAETQAFLARGAIRHRRGTKIAVNDIMAVKETAAHLIDGLDGRARAFVQVQNGCDHRCTFCIIPYGRGNSRSVPMGEVVAQVRRLVDNGYREMVLTGVDLTSYGGNLPGAPRLGTLVKQILKHVAGAGAAAAVLDRFGRGRPRPARCVRQRRAADAAPASVAAARRRPDPQAHEAPPFRAPTRSRSATRCARLRPDVVFGADIIAGFPTETEEMFARSLDLVDECGLTHLHVFPFSATARHAGRAHAAGARARSSRSARGGCARRARRRSPAHLAGEVGATRRVLAETRASGRTEHFTPVRLDAPIEPGVIVDVTVIGHDGRRLIAA